MQWKHRHIYKLFLCLLLHSAQILSPVVTEIFNSGSGERELSWTRLIQKIKLHVIQSTRVQRILIYIHNNSTNYVAYNYVKKIKNLYTSCAFGRICSSLLVFFTLKHSTAGDGLLVNTLIIPLGNDIVISPVIFTIHLEKNKKISFIATL